MAKIFQRPDDHRTGIGWTQDIFAPHGWGRKLETQWIQELNRWKPGTDRYRSSQGDGSVTRMTVRYGVRMRTSRNVQVIRCGMAHIKGYCLSREDPESTLSGSETQEARPGWPPDDMCTYSTRYKGSFDDRDREGLRLLSPLFQKKVLKLQRDLEEAKAES